MSVTSNPPIPKQLGIHRSPEEGAGTGACEFQAMRASPVLKDRFNEPVSRVSVATSSTLRLFPVHPLPPSAYLSRSAWFIVFINKKWQTFVFFSP